MKRELGVIIARFQAPSLTMAHQYLLSQVATRVNRVLVLLGVAPVPCLKKNPLEYGVRAKMVDDWWKEQGFSADLTILPLLDCPTDFEWAARLDAAIALVNINGNATIFCGPDGAGPTYREAGGRWPIEILDSMGGHASKIRENIVPRYTEDFRAGAIYSIERAFVNPKPCVDAIIIDGQRVLLARKPMDGEKWRLIGGFAEVNESWESAVRREVLEETGLIVEPFYVGSAPVNDWRYRSGPESITTSLFMCQVISGEPVAADDIAEVRWFDKREVENVIHPVHAGLIALGLRRVQ